MPEFKENKARHAFALIEPDPQVRMAVSAMLVAEGHSVEPFDEVGEMPASWLGRRLILMRDVRGAFSRLVAMADRAHIWPRVILYADEPAPEDIASRIKQGAVGYIFTPECASQILSIVETDDFGGSFISRIKWRVYQAERAMEGLTPREHEILALVANGHTSRQIATLLKLSTRTVEVHRANLLSKLGARTSAEAVRLTVERSLMTT